MFHYQFSPINSPVSLRGYFVLFITLANSFDSTVEGKEIHMLLVFCKELYVDFYICKFLLEKESLYILVYR